jgi:hypothetical protein
MAKPLPQGFFTSADMQEYATLIKSLPDGATMVECGVWLGRSLCSVAHLIVRKKIRVIAVDSSVRTSALGHPPPPDGPQTTFLRNLAVRGITPTCYWMPSLEAAKLIDPVDFVFLDDNHEYDYVVEELAAWLPKAKRIIGGHDYSAKVDPRVGVKRAVDEAFPSVRVRGYVWSVRLA